MVDYKKLYSYKDPDGIVGDKVDEGLIKRHEIWVEEKREFMDAMMNNNVQLTLDLETEEEAWKRARIERLRAYGKELEELKDKKGNNCK